jgi:oxygen tolerance protein BatD
MTIKLIITLVFLLLFSQFIQAEISVSVDRSPVVVDESFKLIFESNQKVDGEPDFSPLNRSFTVLNTGRRSNTQIINGKITRSQQWTLTVIANQTGTLSIPSIHFGKDVSQPGSIKVVANAPAMSGNKTDDIFIEVEVNTKTPYVQAQVIYTVKLYRAVQTNNASLSEPEISGSQAVINKLGEDKSFETRLNGKRYTVRQRQYVIFPQTSGTLKIEPLIFQGQTGLVGFFNFDPFGSDSKLIVKRSASINLDIKHIPDSFTGDTWLPASQITIQEQWSVDPGKLQQGEATTRTLTLKANGLVASNLPEIENNLPVKLKQYPDQPEYEETYDENGFIGIRHDKMAIIPTEAGDYILPAIKIPWWNTGTDKMEFAELPERSIHVDVSDTAPVNDVAKQIVEDELTVAEEIPEEKNMSMTEAIHSQTPWKWLSLILFILWGITLFLFWKSRRKPTMPDNHSAAELSNRQYLKQLKQACAVNDAAKAKQALLDWAKGLWPDEKISSINAVKMFCEKEFQLKLDELNACLYGKTTIQWNGANFFKSFESQSFKNKKSEQAKGNLEPLYKT